jgi:hypothetical protein
MSYLVNLLNHSFCRLNDNCARCLLISTCRHGHPGSAMLPSPYFVHLHDLPSFIFLPLCQCIDNFTVLIGIFQRPSTCLECASCIVYDWDDDADRAWRDTGFILLPCCVIVVIVRYSYLRWSTGTSFLCRGLFWGHFFARLIDDKKQLIAPLYLLPRAPPIFVATPPVHTNQCWELL